MPGAIRTTRTLEDRIDLRGDPCDPVTALRFLPDCRMVDLGELVGDGRRVSVGASPFANLAVFDEYVSTRHCMLWFEKQRLFVKCVGAKNRTLVNGVPLRPKSGYVELVPGAVLTLGRTQLLVCGRAGAEQPAYTAPPMAVLLARAYGLFGNGARAAARLGVEPRTFSNWVRKKFPLPSKR